jgi:hypothetical protein
MTGVTALVIDYLALARTAMPAAMPIAKPGVMPLTPSSKATAPMRVESDIQQPEMQVQLSRAKETIVKKDTEINMLRRESDWMKRELRERDEEIRALKASVKKQPVKKKVEAYRTR